MTTKQLWPQKSSALLDIPTNQFGSLDAEAGQVLVVNANRDGLAFAAAGTGGTAGPPGPANSLVIGTVQSGPTASAVITGISPAQQLNLVLPKGDTGATGATGEPGPQGNPGPTGAAGAGLVPDGYGDLTDAFVAATELAAVTTVYVVNPAGDLRANQMTPAGLEGNQSLKIIGYTVAGGWQSYGQFTGIQGPPGIQGIQGPPGADSTVPGPQGEPGLNGVTQDVSGFLIRAGDKSTGVQVFGKAVRETAVDIPALAIDASLGGLFSKVISADSTLTVSGTSVVPYEVDTFLLSLTNGGSFLLTWWPNLKWPGGVPPELTAVGTDVLGFYKTSNSGNWVGFLVGADVK